MAVQRHRFKDTKLTKHICMKLSCQSYRMVATYYHYLLDTYRCMKKKD